MAEEAKSHMQKGYENAKEDFQKIAIRTVAGATIGGICGILMKALDTGNLTPDFTSGFIFGLLAGSGIGFGFGIVYAIKRYL
jgi:hypothetical protein